MSPGSLEEPSEPAESDSDSPAVTTAAAGDVLAVKVGAVGTGFLSFGLDRTCVARRA